MDQTGILVFIGIACFLFTVVSAYLIYNHVQDEKEQVYRARLRREKDQMGPSEHLTHSPNTKRKLPLAGPVVVPPQMITGPDPDPVPAPDPVLDPIIIDELPAEPEAEAPPEPAEPTDMDIAPLIAMAAPVAVAGGVVAATVNQPPAAEKAEKEKAPKRKKSRRGSKKAEDFEDYRNFSPKALPPPKAAPPAAKYEPPMNPVYTEQMPTQSIPMKSLERLERLQLDREGLRF